MLTDVFVSGVKRGWGIATGSMLPNVLMAFILIYVLKLTGILDLIGTVCGPVMKVFGLPGEALMVLLAAWLSMGGGAGVAGLGQWLELAAARGGDGELGANEEGVAGQEDDSDQEGERSAHRRSPSGPRLPGAASGSLGRTWRRVTRRPSMASTVRDA